MFAPVVIRLCSRGVFNILQNALQYIDVVGITGILYGFYQVQWCFMKVAPGVNVSNIKSIVAMVFGPF